MKSDEWIEKVLGAIGYVLLIGVSFVLTAAVIGVFIGIVKVVSDSVS